MVRLGSAPTLELLLLKEFAGLPQYRRDCVKMWREPTSIHREADLRARVLKGAMTFGTDCVAAGVPNASF